MNNNEARVFATFLIWTAVTVVAVTALVTGNKLDMTNLTIMTTLLFVGAAYATRSIWASHGSSESGAAAGTVKSKRRNRVERLLDSMSEDDLAELHARLAESDGEMVSLRDELERMSRHDKR